MTWGKKETNTEETPKSHINTRNITKTW